MTKHYISIIFTLAFSLLKRFFRDPVAIFFTFLFPLLFLFVFGSIFRGNSDISFDVAMINRSETPFAQQFVDKTKDNKLFKVNEDLQDVEKAKQLMGRGEIDSIIELPTEFGQPNEKGLPSGNLVVYYEQGNPQTGQTMASIMQQVLDGINKE